MDDDDAEIDEWDGALVDLLPLGLVCGGSGTPLGETWIDLSSPDQVFYGLNGAGKTHVLESLHGALTGRSARGRLLATVPWESEALSNGLSDALSGLLFGDDLHDVEEVHADFVATQSEALKAQFSTRRRWRDWQLDGQSFGDLNWDGLLDELVASQYWVFTPIGTELGQWSVSPVVVADSASPWSGHVEALIALRDSDEGVELADFGVDLLWPNSCPTGAPLGIVGTLLKLETRRRERFPYWPFGQVITDSSIDPPQLTRRHLRTYPVDRWGGRTPLSRGGELGSRVASIEQRANLHIVELLVDAPALRLELGDDEAWFEGRSCGWTASRFEGDNSMTLSDLSWAEERWAGLAIQLALAEESPAGTTWLLLDEPERGLHRTAEAHMARGIRGRTGLGRRAVVATHSPELLDSGSAEVKYVRRRSRDRVGAVVPMGDFEQLRADLGLNHSDLLRRTRGIALVEGVHDIAVLRGTMGPDLERLGVTLLATRGGHNLKTVVDSRFLYEFTDAVLFPILDDLLIRPVNEVWEDAVQMARTASSAEAVKFLNTRLRKLEGKGTDYAREFLAASLTHGSFDRVKPLGIPQTDILECLPVTAFASDATSWEQLRADSKRSNNGVETSETKFKKYLDDVHSSDLTEVYVRRVAENSPVHPDINAILAAITERLSS